MIKQNPFSLYDFLGYFIPGSFLIFSFLIIYELDFREVELDSIFNEFYNVQFEGVLFFLVLAYILGHLLSFLSSVTVERYGNWKYGYPSKYLLGIQEKGYWKEEKNLKHLILKNLARFLVLMTLLPLAIMNMLVELPFKILNEDVLKSKELDELLKESIKEKFKTLVKKLKLDSIIIDGDLNANNTDFHRIVTHYVFENSKNHQFRMVNYVALYGFLRTISFIFQMLTWCYIYRGLKTVNFKLSIDWTTLIIIVVLIMCTFISFKAFMKFYRRYTLEGLMLLVVDKDI